MKYKLLEDSGADEEAIKMFKITDEHIMSVWKDAVISKYSIIWPKKFHNVGAPKTWEQAINSVNSYYKEQIWKK